MRTEKNTELVTIVTVTYNAKELLEETILSIINQSYQNIKYIIIDGASTDGTVEMVKKYEDKIDYWISEPDDGIYFAMNKAIEKATGEWINFMNAGDTFLSYDTVEYVMEHLDDKAEVVYGNCKLGSQIAKPHNMLGYDNITALCHQTLFVKTKLAKETPFDTRYKICADHNFILQMHQLNKKFQYLDIVIADFLPNGLSETQMLRLRIEALAILFANDVPEDEIIQSRWYVNLSKNMSANMKNEKEQIIKKLDDNSKKLSSLQEAIKQITSYSAWKHPLKKYQSYKSMLVINKKIKNLIEGDKVGNK